MSKSKIRRIASMKGGPSPGYIVDGTMVHIPGKSAAQSIADQPCANGTRFFIHNGATEVVLASRYDALELEKVRLMEALDMFDRAWRETAPIDKPGLRSPLYEAIINARAHLSGNAK